MSEEKAIEHEIWMMHDRRLVEHDNKFNDMSRAIQQMLSEAERVGKRVDNGLSPAINQVRDQNSEIKTQISNLDHKLELNLLQMREQTRTAIVSITDGVEARLVNVALLQKSQADEILWLRRILYGSVLTMLLGLAAVIFMAAFKYTFRSPPDGAAAVTAPARP